MLFNLVIRRTFGPRRYSSADKSVVNKQYKGDIDAAEAQKIVFEHYKLSSEMARQAIDRRIEVSKFFVATFGAALAGLITIIKVFENRPELIAFIPFVIGATGILLSENWRKWITFLVNQSSCRQEVLEEFEQLLPTAHWRPINARLENEGWDSKELEKRVALAFMCGSVLITGSSFVALCVIIAPHISLH